MKPRLPILGSRPSEPRKPPALTAARLASPRILICVVGTDDAATSFEFALKLVRAIAAAGGVPAGLLTSSAGEWPPGAAARLRAEGAREVCVVPEPDVASVTLAALAALAPGTICVAVGWPLAACVRGLLLIRVGGLPAGQGSPQPDGVDLDTGTESLGVATMLGTWLAQRLDASHPNSYPPNVAERSSA